MKKEKFEVWTSTRFNITEMRIAIRLLEMVAEPTRDQFRMLHRLQDHIEGLDLPKIGRPPSTTQRPTRGHERNEDV